MKRRDHNFVSGGQLCAARLHTPESQDGARPCIVMAHGLDGAGNARLGAFAERFADAGIAALVFDYRHFGHSEGEPRRLVDRDRQLEDWRAAINFARMLQGIDPRRVAVWGTALSAGHVATIAADDPEIAAAISQAPGVSGLAALRAAGPRAALRIALANMRDQVRRMFGRPPSFIPLVGPPGSLAAMTAPGAEPGYRALFEAGEEATNEATARGLLRLVAYRPATRAPEIQCPWLVCVCDGDRITPPRPAVKAAARAPRGEIRHYDADHFDIYVGPTFEMAVSDQIDFLRRHLLTEGGDQPALR
jgi:pimeloyl-ACP methyl ester carboxylesterase